MVDPLAQQQQAQQQIPTPVESAQAAFTALITALDEWTAAQTGVENSRTAEARLQTQLEAQRERTTAAAADIAHVAGSVNTGIDTAVAALQALRVTV